MIARISVVGFILLRIMISPVWGQIKLLTNEDEGGNHTISTPPSPSIILPNARVNPDTSYTTDFPFFDDFSTSRVNPDPSKWLPNQGTLINNTYPVNQPSRNVATFDGVNSVGKPYSTIRSAKGYCDSLTSQYIDLSSFGSKCSIPTLTFAWQCGGLGEAPDALEYDSLVVQFKDSLGNWSFQWGALANNQNDTFFLSRVPVNDPVFYHSKFQFRFYTKGTQSGSYDVWNVDYVSLDASLRQDYKGIYFIDNLNGWAVGTCGALIHTVNGGTNWSTVFLDSTLNLNDVAFSDANNGVAVGDGGKLAKYKYGTWSVVNSGVSNNLKSICFSPITNSIGWIVGDNGQILKTSDTGSTWNQQNSGTNVNLNSVTSKDDQTILVAGNSGNLIYSTDGNTWQTQDPLSNSTANFNYAGYLANSTFYVAGDSGVLISSSALGANWNQLVTNTYNPLYAVNFVGLDTAWALGSQGTTSISLNGGSRWTTINPITKWDIHGIYSNSVNQMWLCGNNNFLELYDKPSNSWIANSSFISTYFKDKAYTNNPTPILRRYNAMPIKQYVANALNETRDTLVANIKNLYEGISLITYQGNVLINSLTNGNKNKFNYINTPSPIRITDKLSYSGYPSKSNLASLDPDQSYVLTVKDSLDASDFPPYTANDTISTNCVLSNYYAYDDGSAEGTVIMNQQFGRAAVRFVLNVPDTISAIDICFTQVLKNLSYVSFNLYVWKYLSNEVLSPSLFNNLGAPASVIYGDSLNKFTRYKLTTRSGNDTMFVVSDTIYIGYRQITSDNLTIGFDKNTDASSQMFFETTGKWEKYNDQYDYYPGSIMIRPVFGKRALITGSTDKKLSEIPVFGIYPNPSSGEFHLTGMPVKAIIIDLTGRVLLEANSISNDTLNVDFLSDGIYIIQLFDKDGRSSSQRLVIQK